ncbi:MAG TPA: hypothetical protein VMC61_06765, partial [Methanocella sp.]|nr:hypothetical protein [Methanocella sp.]
MAVRAEKIASRFPHFYVSWDKSSTVSSLVSSVGKTMDETEKEFVSIMRSHWVDTANGEDLDRLGALFSIGRGKGEQDADYRGRLKTAIISYNGGGTLGSIRMMTRIVLGLPQDYPVEIKENPRVAMKKAWKVRANSDWKVDPKSIADAEPEITIALETKDVKISNPTISNLDTGESVTFNGALSYGEVLKIGNGRATVNGADKTDRLSVAKVPSMPRRKTKWQYTEAIGANLGVFDRAQFDKSVFAVDITSSVTFEWAAFQPASFEVLVPKALLDKSGVKAVYIQRLIDSVKACGVRG